MKVKEYMQSHPIIIGKNKPVRDALRMFLNLQISALLVVDKGTLVGIVTQEDILRNLFPSLQDFVEGITIIDKENILQDNLVELIENPISNFMIKDVKTVTPATSIMHAQSLMLVNKFSHLPVVDNENRLLGIIAQGDIFKALVSNQIPFDTDEEYHDWLAYHWDLVHQKEHRYSVEGLSINTQIDPNSRIIDIGAGTGGHDIELARSGNTVIGFERSKRMHGNAMKKFNKLDKNIAKNLSFVHGENYSKLIAGQKNKFDTALFLGNALAHTPETYKNDLKSVVAALRKGGKLILQVSNSEKILKSHNGFQDFNIATSISNPDKKYAYIEFYEMDPSTQNDRAKLNMVVLVYNGIRWVSAAVNSMTVLTFTQESIVKLLYSSGFSSVTTYGCNFGEMMFTRPFNPAQDDWMNVIAVK